MIAKAEEMLAFTNFARVRGPGREPNTRRAY